jgi:sulfur carrier protein
VITVNGRDFEWRDALTIQAILDAHKYTSPRIVVKVNGEVVRQTDWSVFVVQDGDDVRAIHLIAGG